MREQWGEVVKLGEERDLIEKYGIRKIKSKKNSRKPCKLINLILMEFY